MTLEELKTQYPDLYQAAFEEGKKAGFDEGFEKGKEEGSASGAEAERARIRAIQDLSRPGMEELIEKIKFDGKTTPEHAALMIVQAENAQLAAVGKDLEDDGVEPVDQPATDEPEKPEDKEEDFDALVAREMKENGLSKAAAIAKVARENPEKHRVWIDKINKR